MFIAGSYMLYSAAGAPGVVPVSAVPANYAAAALAAASTGPPGGPCPGGFPVSAFAAPAPALTTAVLHRHRLQHHVQGSSSPQADFMLKKMTGFSVSDILERERSVPVPKTAACVIVSRTSPSLSSSSSSSSSSSAHSGSLSPTTPPLSQSSISSSASAYIVQPESHSHGRSTSVHLQNGLGPGRQASPVTILSRELKFGVERILSNDVAPHKDVSFSPQPYTCCVSPVTPSTLRGRIPGPFDCSHPFCDGAGNIYPFYAYPASALTHSMPYPTCTMYNPAPHHLSSEMDPRVHQVNLHHNSGPTSSSGKRKRSWSRAVFSNLQRKGLEKRFQIQKYITKPDRRQLAATLGLTDAQVKVWFQNRRMKWRHSKEAKEELAKQTTNNSGNKSNDGDGKEKPVNSSPIQDPVTNNNNAKVDSVIVPNSKCVDQCTGNKSSAAPSKPTAPVAVMAAS